MKSGMAAGQPDQSGTSPLDKERQRGPTEAEKTPEAPKPGESQGQQQDQPPQGEKPQDRGQNPLHGENRPSPPRTDDPGKPVAHGDDADKWGMLPERVRQVF